MKEPRKQGSVMNIGTASMIVILIGLSFAILAALAISSARNDYNLTKELAEHTRSYYEATSEAERKLSDIEVLYEERDENDRTYFSVAMDAGQELDVTIHFSDGTDSYEIEQWQVVNTSDWVGDDTLPGLFTGE